MESYFSNREVLGEALPQAKIGKIEIEDADSPLKSLHESDAEENAGSEESQEPEEVVTTLLDAEDAPTVQMITEGDVLKQIIVVCSCGKRLELDCVLKPKVVAEPEGGEGGNP